MTEITKSLTNKFDELENEIRKKALEEIEIIRKLKKKIIGIKTKKVRKVGGQSK